MNRPVPPRTVLITGATSGIGRATAEAFAGDGARLLLLARRADRLKEVQEALGADRVDLWPVDIRDGAALASGAKEHARLLGRVDVLVNNAGLALGMDTVQDGDAADWDAMIDTNVKGLLAVTRLVLPHMVARGAGHVVNLGSITGRQVYRGGTVYAATKFAVRAITESLRHDLLGTGVRVTSVDPGLVQTEFSLVRFRGDAERADRVYADTRTLTPADVADAILWAVTRPPHVNIQEILIMPTDQAASQIVHRRAAT